MEKESQFQQPSLLGGEDSSTSIDEAYFSGVCAGLSFRSLLAGGNFEPAAEISDTLLQTPKIEQLFTANQQATDENLPYNFFSEAALSSPRQLPGLLSFELPRYTTAIDSPAPKPRIESDPYGNPRRKRRQPYRLSEKTRCLRKLLPGDGKMDMATVLEEAYKYIKFLQAQVGVLRLMPCQSSAACGGSATNIVVGDLGKLNRQQLLQVVTNSPVAQAQIFGEGSCIFSAEQVVLVENVTERTALIQQMISSRMVADASFPTARIPAVLRHRYRQISRCATVAQELWHRTIHLTATPVSSFLFQFL